jgi:hypothetical protein
MKLFEIHHFWTGLVIMIIGFVWIFKLTAPWIGWGLIVIGAVLAVEDGLAHTRERSNPEHRGPVWYLWRRIKQWWRS